MKIEKYTITVKSQLGLRSGAVDIKTDGADVAGCLTLLGHQNFFEGKMLRKGHYVISFHMWTTAGDEDCDALLLVHKGVLSGAIVCANGNWLLDGVELADEFIKPKPGAFRSA
ncbi:MAG: hypothetical protein VB112_09915 [Oscillospiraceae bacterium]|nr:hypothetical protein [Oscillospiraceae bacterium]